jgi:hypothetical protein
MSKENIYLVTIGVLLCVLNAILGGPLGVRIAGVFARILAPKSAEGVAAPAKKGPESKSDEVTGDAHTEHRDRAA